MTEAGNRLLESLTKLTNFVLKEVIPIDIQPIFFGANLCALSKKDGGIRPIAVGTTLRRLITKVGFKPISRELGTLFRPNQLGYASKGGARQRHMQPGIISLAIEKIRYSSSWISKMHSTALIETQY